MSYSIIKKRGKVAALDEEIQGMSDSYMHADFNGWGKSCIFLFSVYLWQYVIWSTDLKKDWIKLLLFKKWSQKIAAAALLLGPKKLRVLVMSQCEITPRGLSNARLRIF